MARSDQEVLPEGQEWLEDPTEGPGVVRKPSWKARSDREALLEGQEWLVGPPGGLVGPPGGSGGHPE